MKKRIPRPTSVPMLINREIHKTVETLHENAMVLAFRIGIATKQHFDQLVMMVNMMEIATQIKPCAYGEGIRDKLNLLASKVKSRYDLVHELNMCKADIDMLTKATFEYDEYWKMQTTTLYNQCGDELNAFYGDIRG